MTRATTLLLLLVFGATASSGLAAQLPIADTSKLAAVTQQLLDAVTAGDSLVWARHISPLWFMTDEEGHRLGRAEFLMGLRGLPPGQSGKLRVADWRAVSAASAIVTSYMADEEHTFYGQLLKTRFAITDTWVRESDGYRMLASQVTALPAQVAGRSIPRRVLDAYVGEYALVPGVSLTLAVSDSGLEMIRPSGRERLYALSERIFIRHGVRGFWLLEGDSLVNWRDNNAVRWRKQRPR